MALPMTRYLPRGTTCSACGYHVAVPFFQGGRQPLATLAWPTTAEQARNLPRLPSDFYRCIDCGHIFNPDFDYKHVPYSEKPNLMFNSGQIWSEHIRSLCDAILTHLPPQPVVVEVGHGDGSFLAALAAKRPQGRYIGFDPHGAISANASIDLRAELFDPASHLEQLAPHLVISRHVLEHLIDPLGFLQQLTFAAACCECEPLGYIEVPCIDRVLETGRTSDFYYEHSSQFTTGSFTRMLENSGVEVLRIGHAYGGEVVHAFIRFLGHPEFVARAEDARLFQIRSGQALETIRSQLAALHASGTSVAVWGGTGKSAAFMCQYGMDEERFPTVIDSDPAKVGTFVPGTGQIIRFRDWLHDHPAQVVIIPPQWRAADIIAEMAAAEISTDLVLIEHNGRLIDYRQDEHPYRLAVPPSPGQEPN